MNKKHIFIIVAHLITCTAYPADKPDPKSVPANEGTLLSLAHALEQPGNMCTVRSLLTRGVQPAAEHVIQLFDHTINTFDESFEEKLTKLILCLSRPTTIYTKNGNSLLIEAAKERKPFIAREIAKHCIHYHRTVSIDGKNALHHLVGLSNGIPDIHACIDLMPQLINKPDSDKQTALMLARNPDIAAHLIAHGADINVRNKRGYTALIEQISLPNPEIVSLLLFHRAQFISGYDGKTPHNIAQGVKAIYTELNGPIRFIEQTEPTGQAVGLAVGTQGCLPKIDAIISMLNDPEREKNNPANQQMINRHLNSSPRDIMQREVEPGSYKRIRNG